MTTAIEIFAARPNLSYKAKDTLNKYPLMLDGVGMALTASACNANRMRLFG